ncbi:MAG: hypothetical protein BA872_05455 [Desulfobacterales bacterium C00003060]|nr:MAG: hypothetical protein BA872_05455 [Desulfobacterales bacterium C00003060]OEU83457.1 MAG: hypothetical protein BA865_00200 [Desulfobacterales bacterium S5133MH4]
MKKRNRRLLIILSIIIVCSGVYYFFHGVLAYTSDAYIRANWVEISPRIEGHIKSVSVSNNQYVEKGTIVMEIEKHPYQSILNEKQARLNEAEARLGILKTELEAARQGLKFIQDK